MAWWRDFFDEAYVETWAEAGAFDTTDELVADLVRFLDVPPGARILDVPCGFGRFAGPLAVAGFDVVGVDASEPQIALARQRYPGPEYLVGDMRQPPPGPFDAVLNLYSSFGYFDDPADDVRCIQAWFDVLAPGGVLVLELMHRDRVAWLYGQKQPASFANEEGETDWVTGVRTVRVDVGDQRRTFQVRLYTAKELVAMLRAAGFVDIEAVGSFDRTPLDPTTRLAIRAVHP